MAREIRLITDLIPTIQLPIKTITTEALIMFAVVCSLIVIIYFFIRGLYALEVTKSQLQETGTIISALFAAFLIFIGVVFLANGYLYETQIPRLIIAFAFFITLLGIVVERFILHHLHVFLLKRNNAYARKVLIITDSDIGSLIHDLHDVDLYEIIGYIGKKCDNTPGHLGDFTQLDEIILNYEINEVFCIFTDTDYGNQKSLFEIARTRGVRFKYIGNHFEIGKQNASVQFIGKLPMVEIRSIGITQWGRVIKRILDTIIALGLLILTLPFLFICGVIAAKQAGGSPIYTCIRSGQGGKPFTFYKLRSMRAGSHKDRQKLKSENEREGPLFKIEDDPRITPFGKFIRTWSIDELPQLWNVIKGDMSLIGPRAHLPEEIENYEFHQKRVMTVKPGISGMAQVYGRHENSFEREVELDLFYIENWSILLDIKIFFRTIHTIVTTQE